MKNKNAILVNSEFISTIQPSNCGGINKFIKANYYEKINSTHCTFSYYF